jgi:hypothetical protein
VGDIVNRTHVAQDQEQALLATELVLKAQKNARWFYVRRATKKEGIMKESFPAIDSENIGLGAAARRGLPGDRAVQRLRAERPQQSHQCRSHRRGPHFARARPAGHPESTNARVIAVCDLDEAAWNWARRW